MSNNNITERDLGYAPFERYNYVNTIPANELKNYENKIMGYYYDKKNKEDGPSSVGGKKQRKTRKYRKHNKKSVKSNSKKINKKNRTSKKHNKKNNKK